MSPICIVNCIFFFLCHLKCCHGKLQTVKFRCAPRILRSCSSISSITQAEIPTMVAFATNEGIIITAVRTGSLYPKWSSTNDMQLPVKYLTNQYKGKEGKGGLFLPFFSCIFFFTIVLLVAITWALYCRYCGSQSTQQRFVMIANIYS